jgi:hypothetical protein
MRLLNSAGELLHPFHLVGRALPVPAQDRFDSPMYLEFPGE